MRQLASVQRITSIGPIEGADAIEVATVLGWKVVVRKGEFQVGDLAVYLEIDSIPPDEEQYRFLWRNTEMRPNNFRIKTVKLRGQISQGILFPLSVAESAYVDDMDQSDSCLHAQYGSGWAEGDDVTDLLSVTKYEAPLPNGAGNIEGQFFDGVPKTDEDRVQSRLDLLKALQGRPFYVTVKCDGASMTVAEHDGKVKVASRNYRLAESNDSAYWRAARASDGALLKLVTNLPWLAVQGELVGPGIQNNRLGLDDHRCYVFNIYDRKEGRYLSYDEMVGLELDWGIVLVPFVERGRNFTRTLAEVLNGAKGKYMATDNAREGIVIRSDDDAERISFKAINNDFLLKGGE